jgi:hypothetical protein
MEDIKKVFETKVAVKILYIIGIIIVAMIIFSAGISVGFHKASFGRTWGEHYNENFGMGKIGMTNYFPNAHGAAGKIIKIELPNIIVQDKDKTEKVVTIDADTKIQEGRADIETKDLHLDDFVVVIGEPNSQGQILAKFIRVLPFDIPVTPPQTPAITQ